MRARLTRDIWEISGNYGHGWEVENTEETRRDAVRSLREYRDNGPGIYRLAKLLERIEPQTPSA